MPAAGHYPFSRLVVFVSSRVEQRFAGTDLKTLRDALADELARERLFAEQLFDVQYNESWPSLPGDKDIWQHCEEKLSGADIVLVLYTGSSGWRQEYGTVGICHAELQTAMHGAPQRIRAIRLLPEATLPRGHKQRDADMRFRDYWGRLSLIAPAAHGGDQLREEARRAVREAVATLAHTGGSRGAGREVGSVLDWTRLGFPARAAKMREQLRLGLGGSPDRPERGPGDAELVVAQFDGLNPVLICCHAVPAALSVSAARELVGQPFLHDYRLADRLDGVSGPVHLVACHRGVTESQAVRQLGFPDATIVREGFGVYIADDVQKIQVVMLRDCRDPSSTRIRLDELRRWLTASRESERLVERAAARAAIARTIAENLEAGRA